MASASALDRFKAREERRKEVAAKKNISNAVEESQIKVKVVEEPIVQESGKSRLLRLSR